MEDGLIYFRDGTMIAQSGLACVYKMNNQLFLEKGPGHTLWAVESELGDYIWQLNDKPKGDCLEIGLGLGVASRYILSFPQVNTLTTVEKDADVVRVQAETNLIEDERHIILNSDGILYAYSTNRVFDFIFLDFYTHIDEDTLPEIADMARACKRLLKSDSVMMGWIDPATSEEDVRIFNDLMENI